LNAATNTSRLAQSRLVLGGALDLYSLAR